MDEKTQLLMNKLKKVCTCKQVTKTQILKAIDRGYDDLESIQRETGAGSGYCKGKHCTEIILELIDDHWNAK